MLLLRKLVPGGSEHSFGIHVAKMAGMPQQVLHRANKILKKLEQSHGMQEKGAVLKKSAEEELQLPPRDTRKSDKAAAREQKDIERGRRLRESQGRRS